MTCQVRLKPEFVTGIADIHAKITISPTGSATVVNVSKASGSVKIKRGSSELEVGEEEVPLQHSDVITICTRSFRFEEVSPEEEANGKRRSDGDDSPHKKKQKKQMSKVPGVRRTSSSGLSKWVEASLKVLQKEGRPMNIKEIAQSAIANGTPPTPRLLVFACPSLLTLAPLGFVTEVGLTPWNSVTAELHRDIKNPNSVFKKFAAGVFGLKEHSYIP
jgi:hypothetical protein